MKVDLYGSRPSLINLLNNRSNLQIEINKAYIGTSFDSQMKKATKIDERLMKKYLNEYEQLELLVDSRKLFRKLQNISESNIIFIDFLSEGKTVMKINDGVLLQNLSLKRCIKNIEEGREISIDRKVKDLNVITDNFIKYLSTYDLIILNKLRHPKRKKTSYGYQNKNNLDHVNFLNYYTESFEDLILEKMTNIEVIEEYDIPKNLVEGYYYERNYIEYFLNRSIEILNKYK